MSVLIANRLSAQVPQDIDKLIKRLVELDSIDIAKEVKFHPGLLLMAGRSASG